MEEIFLYYRLGIRHSEEEADLQAAHFLSMEYGKPLEDPEEKERKKWKNRPEMQKPDREAFHRRFGAAIKRCDTPAAEKPPEG